MVAARHRGVWDRAAGGLPRAVPTLQNQCLRAPAWSFSPIQPHPPAEPRVTGSSLPSMPQGEDSVGSRCDVRGWEHPLTLCHAPCAPFLCGDRQLAAVTPAGWARAAAGPRPGRRRGWVLRRGHHRGCRSPGRAQGQEEWVRQGGSRCQGGCRLQGLPQGAYCCLQTPATGRGRPRLTAQGDYREPGAAKRAKGEQHRGRGVLHACWALRHCSCCLWWEMLPRVRRPTQEPHVPACDLRVPARRCTWCHGRSAPRLLLLLVAGLARGQRHPARWARQAGAVQGLGNEAHTPRAVPPARLQCTGLRVAPPAVGLGAGLGAQLGGWGCNEALGGSLRLRWMERGRPWLWPGAQGSGGRGLFPAPGVPEERCWARGARPRLGTRCVWGGNRSLPGLFAAHLKRGIFVLGPR